MPQMHSAFIPPTEYRPLTRMFLSNSDWYNPTVRRNYGFPSFNGDVLVKLVSISSSLSGSSRFPSPNGDVLVK